MSKTFTIELHGLNESNNFSLYVSLLTFGEKITDMLPWLIAWNVLC